MFTNQRRGVAEFFEHGAAQGFLRVVEEAVRFQADEGKEGLDQRLGDHAVVPALLRAQAQEGEDFPRYPLFQWVFELGPAVFVGAAFLEVVFSEVVENLLHLCGIAAAEICVGGLVQIGEGEGIGLRWVNRQGEMVLGEAKRQGDEGAGGRCILRGRQ